VNDDSLTTPRAIVLAVDDDRASRYFVTRALRGAGLETIEAATGREALALASQAALIVLDIHLPDMNGLLVARELKMAAATRDIPVIHLSSTCTSESDRALGLEGGAAAYLTHPIEPHVLVSTVEIVLRAAEVARDIRAARSAATDDPRGDASMPAVRSDFTTERLTRIATTTLRMDGVVLRTGEGPAARFVFEPRDVREARVDLGSTIDDAVITLQRFARGEP
jgi:DNA-binding response OmpR family regulator